LRTAHLANGSSAGTNHASVARHVLGLVSDGRAQLGEGIGQEADLSPRLLLLLLRFGAGLSGGASSQSLASRPPAA